MAEVGCGGRVLNGIAEFALLLRQPTRRFMQSVHSAVVLSAIVVGAYELVIGSVYLTETSRFYYGMSGLLTTSGIIAFVTAFLNAALIYGILRKQEVTLHSIICHVLAAYMLAFPTCLSVTIGVTWNGRWPFQIWEFPRLLIYPVHVCLAYCLLVEVRKNKAFAVGAPENPGGGGDGWLKNNLATHGHAPLAVEKLVLKVDGGKNPPTTPVHQSTPHLNASGPISSSEA